MLSKWFKILCTTQSLKSAYSVLKSPIDICSFTRCVKMQALLMQTGIFCLLHFSDWVRKSKKDIDLKFVTTVCNVNAVQTSSGNAGNDTCTGTRLHKQRKCQPDLNVYMRRLLQWIVLQKHLNLNDDPTLEAVEKECSAEMPKIWTSSFDKAKHRHSSNRWCTHM